MTKTPPPAKKTTSAKSKNDALKKEMSALKSLLTEEIGALKKTVTALSQSTEDKFESLPQGQFADTELILRSLMSQLRHGHLYNIPLVPKTRDDLQVSKIHGHLMMTDLILSDYINNPRLDFSKRKILEVGTIRENIWNQSSTSRLGCLARMLETQLISVDMDPNNAVQAKEICAPYGGYISFVTAPGETYLAEHEGECATYVYIDAYDFDHPNHSDHRQSRYEEMLGERINDAACWQMHLDCAKELVNKLPEDGTIVLDDVWYEGGEWQGKGHTAMPFLLKNKFSLVAQSWSTAALRRL